MPGAHAEHPTNYPFMDEGALEQARKHFSAVLTDQFKSLIITNLKPGNPACYVVEINTRHIDITTYGQTRVDKLSYQFDTKSLALNAQPADTSFRSVFHQKLKTALNDLKQKKAELFKEKN